MEQYISLLKYKEDTHAIVLDYLPRGYTKSKVSLPVVQAISVQTLTLLELRPKKEATLSIGEKVYIGKDKRDKINHIVKRLFYNQLTGTAQKELEEAISKIIDERENDFVEFFNKAESINIREHQLDLLPGMGKKTLWTILEERKKEPFKSLEDIKQRVAHFDPKKILIKRILQEIQGKEKIYLFARPPFHKARAMKMRRR